MSGTDPYEAWKRKRSDVEVDPQFTGRVMEAVRASGAPPEAEPAPRGVFLVAARFVAAAALVAASVVLGVLRIESVAALVLFFSSEGF
ncbi:MAG: hypothetical protein ABIK89_15890 [Planctomycetota bacterium]